MNKYFASKEGIAERKRRSEQMSEDAFLAPRQANGFDCGMYVLCISELLRHAHEGAAAEEAAAAVRELTPAAVTAKRREWLEGLRG